MTPLGQPPRDHQAERQWRTRIAVIAAYPDQHKITTTDPRQVLGPYAEPGHSGHKGYWHAAESVLAARQLAGLSPAPETTNPDTRTRAHLAADTYRSLPRQNELPSATRCPPASHRTPLARQPHRPRRRRRHPARPRHHTHQCPRQTRPPTVITLTDHRKSSTSH